jgi:hypothetical protein
MAQLTVNNEIIGVGGLVLLIGFLLLATFPIGTIIGVFLIIWGGNLVKVYRCAACGNKVESVKILVCPVCKEKLS